MKCSRPAHLKSTVVIEGQDSEGHIFSFIKEVKIFPVISDPQTTSHLLLLILLLLLLLILRLR